MFNFEQVTATAIKIQKLHHIMNIICFLSIAELLALIIEHDFAQ